MTTKARILVAEDDPVVRDLTCRVLESAGHETIGASDGVEALRLARSQRPDLALLDINMPRMDGFEVLQHIKADPELATILVIIVSASRTDTDSQVQGLQSGADGYLVRPISNRELLARIQAMLRLKAAEDAVRAKERQLRDLITSNIDGMLVIDSDGRVLFANPAACALLHRAPETIVGQHIGVPLTAGEHTEIDLRHPDGLYRVVELRVTAIEWEGQAAILAALRDITGRKQAEDALRQLNSELEQRVEERTRALQEAQEQLVRREKLAVLGQLAGSVGHELRNPLAVISNAVYYLKLAQPEAEPKIRAYLDMIEAETRAADKIITDLLNFARIKSAAPEAVSVRTALKQTLARFPAPANVRVLLDLPADLPPLWVDPLHLEHVLGNLALNAFQAMPDGGELTISAQATEMEATRWVIVSLSDTGVGIAPEHVGRLFEPLFTTKPGGVGLGLSVSKELMTANGGRIEVLSKPGAGSTFKLILPACQEG